MRDMIVDPDSVSGQMPRKDGADSVERRPRQPLRTRCNPRHHGCVVTASIRIMTRREQVDARISGVAGDCGPDRRRPDGIQLHQYRPDAARRAAAGQGRGGQAPKFDVEVGKVEVGTVNRSVEVPAIKVERPAGQ
ncbi:hypothetical protein [Sphingomonas hankookensis]|uniref:hypothetical protein n=1 Tax=Sphingomonas hankookensis TaxID=563996 RepID=UPI003F7ADCDA